MINRIEKRDRYRAMLKKRKHAARRVKSPGRRKGVNVTLHMPETIEISMQCRDETLKVIEHINNYAMEGYRLIIFDFKKTKRIISDGMLLIYAEVCNTLNIYKKMKFKCHHITNNKTKQVLKQIGFFDLCEQKCDVKITRDDVVSWRVCSGVGVISSKFDDIVEQEKEFKQLPPESDLYAGCVEATKNVRRHAYIENLREVAVRHDKEAWWCFSQMKDNKLTVVVCDLGVSIPYTLPKKKIKLYRLMRLLGTVTDADLIEGAATRSTSRSEDTFRGNGLPKIAEIAKVTGGSLAIQSRNGFVYFKGRDSATKTNFVTPLNGTVIAWTLPLGGEV